MELLRTEKKELSDKDILKYIGSYEARDVAHFDELWKYYKGKNVSILTRERPDANNPDNRVPVPYGRKIINTFTGYAYKPRYITYKPVVDYTKLVINEGDEDGNGEDTGAQKSAIIQDSAESKFCGALKEIFANNKEHMKTTAAGRNVAIFGASYEVIYIDKGIGIDDNGKLMSSAILKFFTVDPRKMIVLYDYSPEPEKIAAIRFYKLDENNYHVEVYYRDKIQVFIRKRNDNKTDWILVPANDDNGQNTYVNYFGEVPVVAYYAGDSMMGIFEHIIPLIDAYDTLTTDSMNEFDRFAFAYLVMKKFGLTDPLAKKDPNKLSEALKLIKRRRIFENIPDGGDVKFLTKDIPHEFIKFMSDSLHDQIHVQSHVPDFASDRTSNISGVAMQRLMFDFENLCSSIDADIDVGLCDRIDMIGRFLEKIHKAAGDSGDIVITHKRNSPLNLLELSQIASNLKTAGLSMRAILSIMPEDIIPNIDVELAYEKKEYEEKVPSLEDYKTVDEGNSGENGAQDDGDGNGTGEEGNDD